MFQSLMHCPNCGSRHLESCPDVYSDNISTTEYKGRFYGYGAGSGYFAGRSRTKSTTMNALARKVMPPDRSDVGTVYKTWAIILGLSVFVLLFVTLLENLRHGFTRYVAPWAQLIGYAAYPIIVITVLTIIVLLIIRVGVNNHDDRTRYQPRLVKWYRSYYCHRCKQIVEPNA